MHKTVPHNKNYVAQNVSSVKDEELWADPLFSPCWQIAEVGILPTDKSLIVSSTSQPSPGHNNILL